MLDLLRQNGISYSHKKLVGSFDEPIKYDFVVDRFGFKSIVYDTFHIIKLYNDQVIDSLKRQEAGRLKKLADSLTASGKADEAATVEQERRLFFGARFLLLANNRTLEAKDKLNRQLNAEAKEAALKDVRNPDDVGHRRNDNADSKAAILSSNEKIQNAVKARGGAL